MERYIAHVRVSDGKIQPLNVHLTEAAKLCAELTAKIGLTDAGALIGLLHDFGKYCEAFRTYIGSATGKINPDEDDYVDAKGLKGKIDHSSAGAQWIWRELNHRGKSGRGELIGQILALCIASHHSGLIDCLAPDGKQVFHDRMGKEDEKTHLSECEFNADPEILLQAKNLLNDDFLKQFDQKISAILQAKQQDTLLSSQIRSFYLGFFTRFLFSCLIDADRINSADFERPEQAAARSSEPVDWQIAISRLEAHLEALEVRNPIDKIRQDISNHCLQKSAQNQGIYTLTVPTGGGKTYASLRYALHHAKAHQLDRIIYIIPYTSIIDQNAAAVREILERAGDAQPWVLEHHSNLEPELQTWHSKIVSDNWDAPIVFTTMVQFLETAFGSGTRGVRRLHQLSKSVLIFDEIQTLPINCTHLFCNALNFLTEYAQTTAVLCTATQPLLDDLKTSAKGQLYIPAENELMPDTKQLFEDLKRVEVVNKCRTGGWDEKAVAEFALAEFKAKGSGLIIVNTKSWAQQLFLLCQKAGVEPDALFHLSTNQCAAHRKDALDKVRHRLAQKQPVLCISTQLIEAGVDVDFATVIRFLAGLDSIAQAAGRCNRSGALRDVDGNLIKGMVYVLNPDQETTGLLKDIEVGKEKTRRILGEGFAHDLLSPESIKQYFQYYFYERSSEMDYPLAAKQIGRDDDLLNLLGNNDRNGGNQNPSRGCLKKRPLLQQSFMSAAKAFKAIDAPTQAVIVPYGTEGNQLITDLCAVAKEFDPAAYYTLLKKAQKYSVNVFPNTWKKLQQAGAVHEIQGEGVFYVTKPFYSDEFGLATERVGEMDALICG